MTTITLQIGNSDDKLTQEGWSLFVKNVDNFINHYAVDIHFTGFSQPDKQWQNACWVFSLPFSGIDDFKVGIKEIRKEFQQDSVAWMQGETKFI